MLEIEIAGSVYQLKHKPEDFLIGEYEKVSSIMNNNELDEIDKYAQLFIELGIPQEELEGMNTISFFELIKKYTSYQLEIGEFTKEIEINGRVYKSFQDEFFLSVKDMKEIEKSIKRNPDSFIGDIMAIVFKDVELTKNEHYVDAHIKYKSKLFRENVTFDKAIPFVAYFSKEVIASLQMFKEVELNDGEN